VSDSIQAVRIAVDNANRIMKDTQELFAKTIADKSIPLADRWKLFVDAPSDMRGNQPWIVHFEIEETLGEINWYDDFYLDRRAEQDMIEFVNEAEEAIKEREEDEEADDFAAYWERAFEAHGLEVVKKAIEDLKEEILESNLGSFVMDW
jgi:hypothetical protein